MRQITFLLLLVALGAHAENVEYVGDGRYVCQDCDSATKSYFQGRNYDNVQRDIERRDAEEDMRNYRLERELERIENEHK